MRRPTFNSNQEVYCLAVCRMLVDIHQYQFDCV